MKTLLKKLSDQIAKYIGGTGILLITYMFLKYLEVMCPRPSLAYTKQPYLIYHMIASFLLLRRRHCEKAMAGSLSGTANLKLAQFYKVRIIKVR